MAQKLTSSGRAFGESRFSTATNPSASIAATEMAGFSSRCASTLRGGWKYRPARRFIKTATNNSNLRDRFITYPTRLILQPKALAVVFAIGLPASVASMASRSSLVVTPSTFFELSMRPR